MGNNAVNFLLRSHKWLTPESIELLLQNKQHIKTKTLAIYRSYNTVSMAIKTSSGRINIRMTASKIPEFVLRIDCADWSMAWTRNAKRVSLTSTFLNEFHTTPIGKCNEVFVSKLRNIWDKNQELKRYTVLEELEALVNIGSLTQLHLK